MLVFKGGGWLMYWGGGMHCAGGTGGSGSGKVARAKKRGLFSEAELKRLEKQFADGLSALEVVDVFHSREVRFSEASLRKYVQLGLLPRSRRVGRKGKNRGSLGLYPVRILRRINTVKKLMGDGFTIEQIQNQFLRYCDLRDAVKEACDELVERVESDVNTAGWSDGVATAVQESLVLVNERARELLDSIDELADHAATTSGDEYRSPSAAGSAEELL